MAVTAGVLTATRQGNNSFEVIDLEDDQHLQEEVLTLYHLSTIAFEMGPAVKSVISSNGRLWIKNMQMQ